MNVHLAADRLPTCSRFIFWNGFVQRVSLYLKKKMYFPFQPAKNITKNLAPSTKNVSPPLQKKKTSESYRQKKRSKSRPKPITIAIFLSMGLRLGSSHEGHEGRGRQSGRVRRCRNDLHGSPPGRVNQDPSCATVLGPGIEFYKTLW
jgi:hypothetical protein